MTVQGSPHDPNTSRAESGWPAAVVACGHQTGVNLARNLLRRGVRVFIVDSNPNADSFRSIYGKSLLCPDPDVPSSEWLDFMLGLGATVGGKAALIAASDAFISAIGRHADALSEKFYISPSAKMQADLALKEGQIQSALQNGLPIPFTRNASSEADVEAFAAECTFPCLFKPQQHRFWDAAPFGHPLFLQKVMISSNRANLLENYRIAAAFSPQVTLQEIIVGPDTNKRVHVALYRRDGTRVGYCNTRQFRTNPKLYGVGSISEPVDDPEVAEVCDRYFRNAGYRGICEIELKRDNRDGKVKMMDINPRYSGGGDAMPYAGLDHGWLHYLDLIGHNVEPVQLPKSDFRHIMVRGDVVAARDYWLGGDLTLAEIWRSYRRPIYFYDLDWRDWRLTASTLWAVVRVLLRTAQRYIQSGFKRGAGSPTGTKTEY